MSYLIDTNVLFAILKGDERLKAFVESNDCSIDSTVYVECIRDLNRIGKNGSSKDICAASGFTSTHQPFLSARSI